MINDVLDLSKIESGHITLNEQNFDLYELLDTLEEMFHLKAESQGLQLIMERTPDVPHYIRTDQKKLRQVLINLISNALKFTQEGGVTLRVRTQPTCIVAVPADLEQETICPVPPPVQLAFEVEDTGCGIADHELDLLFAAFAQTEAGRNLQQGTGLGLPISRKFVQLMGGDIRVSSVLNQGSIFHFDIQVQPVSPQQLQAKIQLKRVISLVPGQPQYRILIVDDRWTNRKLLLKLLVPLGFVVQEAENGLEAIQIWEQWTPHLIFMDMRMPVINGYEATQQIKSHLKGQATIIIALTASSFEEERALILSAGCDDFVRKPFREEFLLEKMTQHLGVSFIYETPGTLTANSPGYAPPELTIALLQQMSPTWIAQLHQAATKLNAKLVLTLVDQIPPDQSILAHALQNLVNQVRFDAIVRLTQQAGNL